MFKAVLISILLLFAAGTTTATEQLDNRRFHEKAMSMLADSLLEKLEITQSDTIWTRTSDSALLLQLLVTKLHKRGIDVYSARQPAVGCLWLRIRLSSASSYPPLLRYEPFDRGLFRQGRIRRICEVNGAVALWRSEGPLWREARVSSLVLVDNLSYSQAEAAREGSGAYAPEMPASLFQRVVEPSLIVGITGTLVYLFFASR
jgi:hypothetical protein